MNGDHMVVIVNATAGGGRGAKKASDAIEHLRRERRVEVVTTQRPEHATEIARGAVQAGANAVVAVGGDGTLFEVVNGMVDHSAQRPALGVIPVGTGNSFLRDFPISDAQGAAKAILRGKTKPVDVIRVHHTEGSFVFANLMSFGLSANAGDLMNRRFKRFGQAGYVIAVLGCLVRWRSQRLRYRCDEGPWVDRPMSLLSFCNTRCTGGHMMMAPGADPSDGHVDVIHIGAMSRMRIASAFPKIFGGTHVEMPEVVATQTKRVRFEMDEPISAMIDGEIRQILPLEMEVMPSALQVLA